MRVLIPHTARHLDTIAGAPAGAEWVDVSSDDQAYWRTLRDYWALDDDLLIVEHDIVCRPDCVEQVQSCPELWCPFAYDDMCHPECMEAWRGALGCTRFRKELIAAVPDAVASIEERYRHWLYMGGALAVILTDAGFDHHWHEPAVHHHHMSLAHLTV